MRQIKVKIKLAVINHYIYLTEIFISQENYYLGNLIISFGRFKTYSNILPFFTTACKARTLGLFLNSSVTGIKDAIGTKILWKSTKMGAFGSFFTPELNTGLNGSNLLAGDSRFLGMGLKFGVLGMMFHSLAYTKINISNTALSYVLFKIHYHYVLEDMMSMQSFRGLLSQHLRFNTNFWITGMANEGSRMRCKKFDDMTKITKIGREREYGDVKNLKNHQFNHCLCTRNQIKIIKQAKLTNNVASIIKYIKCTQFKIIIQQHSSYTHWHRIKYCLFLNFQPLRVFLLNGFHVYYTNSYFAVLNIQHLKIAVLVLYAMYRIIPVMYVTSYQLKIYQKLLGYIFKPLHKFNEPAKWVSLNVRKEKYVYTKIALF
ncbi:hypothetical protein AGLY_006229 [Aphis glycines]|uniref:Uncharacterized protein n=1 Tax=Aphis glycines TaxID=307491 RepID=A0A6G0TQY2_APHGL|nr:hypothetical protein AGLY_006229 [Aphis glycines]